MTVELLREVLGWCTVINFALQLVWWLLFSFAHDWVYRCHCKWVKVDIPVETFDALNYGGMGLYKLAIFMFNLVPYLALRIVV